MKYLLIFLTLSLMLCDLPSNPQTQLSENQKDTVVINQKDTIIQKDTLIILQEPLALDTEEIPEPATEEPVTEEIPVDTPIIISTFYGSLIEKDLRVLEAMGYTQTTFIYYLTEDSFTLTSTTIYNEQVVEKGSYVVEKEFITFKPTQNFYLDPVTHLEVPTDNIRPAYTGRMLIHITFPSFIKIANLNEQKDLGPLTVILGDPHKAPNVPVTQPIKSLSQSEIIFGYPMSEVEWFIGDTVTIKWFVVDYNPTVTDTAIILISYDNGETFSEITQISKEDPNWQSLPLFLSADIFQVSNQVILRIDYKDISKQSVPIILKQK